MKKYLDFLLILPLLLAVLFLAVRGEIAKDWLSGTAFYPMLTKSANLVPESPLLNSSLGTFSSPPTLTPSPTNTFTRVETLNPASILTFTPTFVRTLTPTFTPVDTSTSTATEAPIDSEIDLGVARGTLIVQAIEKYYLDQHYYPPILADLVPVYLTELPIAPNGQPFFYRVFERTGIMSPEIYWVSFKVTSEDHVSCTFFRRIQYWDCNFASP